MQEKSWHCLYACADNYNAPFRHESWIKNSCRSNANGAFARAFPSFILLLSLSLSVFVSLSLCLCLSFTFKLSCYPPPVPYPFPSSLFFFPPIFLPLLVLFIWPPYAGDCCNYLLSQRQHKNDFILNTRTYTHKRRPTHKMIRTSIRTLANTRINVHP